MTEQRAANRAEVLGMVLGNYRVVERLGEGGMGVVYVGRHETLGHRVVVKVLRLELSHNADMVQRFFNEAQAATAIKNPGIVQVFDFGTLSDGRAYLVMELLEGESLAARLERPPLDYAACCRIGRQVANVLQAAHASGITHRDLKPDNLFLVPDPEVAGGERVKVLDFGIAKLAGDTQASRVKTRTGAVMGSPLYMSPEQCRGAGAVDARADIYSLGCILFEMACGRTPFLGEGAGEVIGAHLHIAPPDPRDLARDMPPRLAALISKMLAKRAHARPQSMAEVSQALDEILGSLDGAPRRAPSAFAGSQLAPVSTTLSSSAGATSPFRTVGGRRRWLVIGGGIVASALLGMVVVILIPGGDPPRAPADPPAASGDEQARSAGSASGAVPAEPPAAPPEPAPERPPEVREPAPEPPAPSPAPEPAAPRTVEVAIDSTPRGASVVVAGAVLGKTPFRGTLPHGERDVTIVVRLRGYADRSIVVRPDRSISQRIKLVANPPPRVQPPRNRDYGVNPFGS